MGHTANIIDFRAVHRPKATSAAVFAPVHAGYSDLARLIPGTSDDLSIEKRLHGVSGPIFAGSAPLLFLSRLAAEIVPRFFKRFQATMLPPAILDLTLIVSVFVFETWLLGLSRLALSLSSVCIYISAFLIFAVEENLYSQQKTTMSENGAAIRAVGWATLFGIFSLSWSEARGSAAPVLALSLGSLFVLMAARLLRRALSPANDHKRNVLIVGSGTRAKQISDAIHHDPSSSRLVKGYVAENHIRNIYGSAMLNRIAREEFVDEIIIASTDPGVVRIAIQEACRNKLDVKIAPDISIPPSGNETVFENVGGIALLKIHDHRSPECGLALKRGLDVVLATFGGIALSPLLLLVAILIKLDSSGPVFYRATRAGRKGRQFLCYKFRTMIAEADAVKDNLRTKNERHGAFFKIENDPRVTRIGRFLRKYSVDEIPQLWNVLLGHMSLVGPRPHPPDDVSLYKLQHLQRLDFVPGITGLWQVTARRDPSFERSVALDVEYIKNWNLRLDLRILCKTISAVLKGSGV
ncbi:MAG: exopolysaccharide biosynthesis polyprenyl glycosylphosphotransferase [Acidobacteriaceae bacterium]|nr:exopolysaccharide biosynthesis polyprenyl glycosylphosphotransferase [Acidobacteriaceae bacterium]